MGTLHMLKSTFDAICLSLIFCDGNRTAVFDGGFPQEGDALAEKLNALGGHVNLWILTHPHDDHMGALCHILENHPEIRIDAICYHFPPVTLCEQLDNDPHSIELTKKLPLLCEARKIPVITPSTWDTFPMGNAVLTCLRQPDISITNNFTNNSSTVWRIESGGKRVLILGDLGYEGGEQLLSSLPAGELKSDYVQMAHHGQNGVGQALYQAIDPDYCLWTTPSWLWDNMGPNGYDTGPFKTVIVRGWMSEIGIKRHYVDRDAPFAIEL